MVTCGRKLHLYNDYHIPWGSQWANMLYLICYTLNTLRPRQNGRHFPDDIFKWIFLNENVWISINISLKFDPRGPINNIPTLVQVMAWRRPGDKPLSEPMMVRLPTHICVTRPQWVNPWHGEEFKVLSLWILMLTQCGLVMSYGDMELGQHWLR